MARGFAETFGLAVSSVDGVLEFRGALPEQSAIDLLASEFITFSQIGDIKLGTLLAHASRSAMASATKEAK